MDMTKDEFKKHFKRLCEGYDYKPRQTQMDAFYERLQHYQQQDWQEAVTDLLCAARFPMNLEIILETIERRAEQRRRVSVHTEKQQAGRQIKQLLKSPTMREAMEEKPELMKTLERLLRS